MFEYLVCSQEWNINAQRMTIIIGWTIFCNLIISNNFLGNFIICKCTHSTTDLEFHSLFLWSYCAHSGDRFSLLWSGLSCKCRAINLIRNISNSSWLVEHINSWIRPCKWERICPCHETFNELNIFITLERIWRWNLSDNFQVTISFFEQESEWSRTFVCPFGSPV